MNTPEDPDVPPFIGSPKIRDRIRLMSQDYKYLGEIKALYRKSPIISADFERKRVSNKGGRSKRSVTKTHATSFAKTLEDIDQNHGFPFSKSHYPRTRPFRFLDMGCAPGGFSHYLLSNHKDPIGVGMTKTETGETPLQMAKLSTLQNSDRYTVHHQDLVELAQTYCKSSFLQSSPLKGLSFDVVIAGAFPTAESRKQHLLRPALALSQLLITFRHILPGGNMAIVLNTKAVLWVVEVLALLKEGFSSVVGSEGSALHGIRSSCYIVCVGFKEERRESLIERLIAGLKAIGACQSVPLLEQQDDVKDKLERMECRALLDPIQSARKVFYEHASGAVKTFGPVWRFQYSVMMAELLKKDPACLKGQSLPSTLEPSPPRSFENSKLKHLTGPSSSSKKSQEKVNGNNWRDRVANRAGGDLTERSFERASTTRRRDAANVKFGGFNGTNSSLPREETVSNWRRT